MDLIPQELERVRTAIKIRYGQGPKDRLRLYGLEMIFILHIFSLCIFVCICVLQCMHTYKYIQLSFRVRRPSLQLRSVAF